MLRTAKHTAFVGICLLVLLGTAVRADVSVWLDYANFTTRLSEVATSAGVTAFSGAEVSQIQAGIQTQLNTIYTGFTVGFSSTAPSGDYETLHFGNTYSDHNVLGMAQEIDWLNWNKNDAANLYTANFDFVIDEFNGSVNRSQQLSQLTTALAGSAAHELGHNLGLQHIDAYGDPRIYPGNYANTLGYQNGHIMATGGTGLGETGREVVRNFNTLETAKLEFGEALTAYTPATIYETGGAHTTWQTAQTLAPTFLPLSGVWASDLFGAISGGEYDYYSFTGGHLQRLTADIISDVRYVQSINSYVTLYGPDGATVLASNDNLYYSGNTWNGGSFYSYDSMLLNYVLPQDGTYYLRVRNTAASGGYYDLFTTLDNSQVPEPGTLVLVGLGLAGAGVRLRRRKRTGA